jgi:hypothetical protein
MPFFISVTSGYNQQGGTSLNSDKKKRELAPPI